MPKLISRSAILVVVLLGNCVWADEPKKGPAAKPPSFKVPKEWMEVEGIKADFVLVAGRFHIREGKNAVEVAIIGLDGESGGLVANINRWRGQVGLEPLDEKAALKTVEPIKLDGLSRHFLDVSGPGVADKMTQRVVVAVVRNGEQTWYIRMAGPAEPVKREKPAFDEFLKSIRFEK